jgi:hypothetical protein
MVGTDAVRQELLFERAVRACAESRVLVARARTTRRRARGISGGSGDDARMSILKLLLTYEAMCVPCLARHAALSAGEIARILTPVEQARVVAQRLARCLTCGDGHEKTMVYGVRGLPRFPFIGPATGGD